MLEIVFQVADLTCPPAIIVAIAMSPLHYGQWPSYRQQSRGPLDDYPRAVVLPTVETVETTRQSSQNNSYRSSK